MGEVFLRELALGNGKVYKDIKLHVSNYKILDKKIEKQRIVKADWNGIDLTINCSQIAYYEV